MSLQESLLQVFNRAKHQFVEQRRSKRLRVQRPAMIDMGLSMGRDAGLRSCTICDISADGARIAVISPDSVPQEFWLVTSGEETSRRCRVVWRSTEHIGVSYVMDPMQQPLV